MRNIFQHVWANFQTFPFISIEIQISFLSEKVGDAAFFNFYFADHPGTRIRAVPVLTKFAKKFELLVLPDIVHLHHFGKKRLLDVSLYLRALYGIVQSSK
jgi:hypothetical protein